MSRTRRRRHPSPATLWGLLLASAAGLWALLPPGAAFGLGGASSALVVSLAAAGLALAAGALTAGGATAGWFLGAVILAGAGWGGFLLVAIFVAGAGAATRFGAAVKERLPGGAHRGAGGRGYRNALANGGGAALFALASGAVPPGEIAGLLRVAMAACLATAFSDTVSSEIGQVLGRRPVMITTLRPAAPGTDGAVSPAGTLWGAAAAVLMAAVAWGTGLVSAPGAAAVAAGGLGGNLADSLLGATLEGRGLLDNDAVNYVATLIGAAVAVALALSAD